MAGLINAHNHIYSAMNRGISINGYHPRGFLDILDGMWWTIDRHLLLEDTKYSALAICIDCIKNGVTTVFDHHASYGEIPGSLFAIADAAKQAGVRTCLCYEISDRDGQEKMKQAVQENLDFMAACEKEAPQMLFDGNAEIGRHYSPPPTRVLGRRGCRRHYCCGLRSPYPNKSREPEWPYIVRADWPQHCYYNCQRQNPYAGSCPYRPG